MRVRREARRHRTKTAGAPRNRTRCGPQMRRRPCRTLLENTCVLAASYKPELAEKPFRDQPRGRRIPGGPGRRPRGCNSKRAQRSGNPDAICANVHGREGRGPRRRRLRLGTSGASSDRRLLKGPSEPYRTKPDLNFGPHTAWQAGSVRRSSTMRGTSTRPPAGLEVEKRAASAQSDRRAAASASPEVGSSLR